TPIDRAGAGLRPATHRPDMDGVHEKTGEIDPFGPPQFIQEEAVDLLPHAGPIPVAQPAPTGHATAAAHLLRQKFPGEAALEDEEDAGQRLAVGEGRAAALGTRWPLGDQGFNAFPQRIREEGLSHRTALLNRSPSIRLSFYWYCTQLRVS